MSKQVPIVKEYAWISILPQLLFMILLVLLFYWIEPRTSVMRGAIAYLILSFSIRALFLADHRKGMKRIKQEKFREAIDYFQKTYDFFNRYNWMDKYRYLTLLSSTKISYREIALNNIAFSYSQTGDIEKTIASYKQLLHEFPDSYLASSALKVINSSIEYQKNIDAKTNQ